MIKYKLLYEHCIEIWKQDCEFSKAYTEKAGIYILAIGLVFAHSLFNLDEFYKSIEIAISKGSSSAILAHLLLLISMLFAVYFFFFAMALIFTLISLIVRSFSSLPILTEIAEFKPDGPSNDELERQYYELSKMIQKAIDDNERVIKSQGKYLTAASWCLIIGIFSLMVIGGIYIGFRLF